MSAQAHAGILKALKPQVEGFFLINFTYDRMVKLELLHYELIATTKRLTFDIEWQHPDTIWQGDDDGDYHVFKAPYGYEVISRSVMDIQTERIWLWGASKEERANRSGSMVFGCNAKRDLAEVKFHVALSKWNDYWMEKLGHPFYHGLGA